MHFQTLQEDFIVPGADIGITLPVPPAEAIIHAYMDSWMGVSAIVHSPYNSQGVPLFISVYAWTYMGTDGGGWYVYVFLL